MIPPWAPISFDFDQRQVKEELLSSQIKSHSKVATVINDENGNSVWDPDGIFFKEAEFKLLQKTPFYKVDQFGQKILNHRGINTFQTVNLTRLPYLKNSHFDAWEGELANNDRRPFWIKYNQPWIWNDALDLPYTREILKRLPFKYLLTVRCILQFPPSIGVVHRDSGPKMNQKFFEDGFGSITLNICSGNARLCFLNPGNNKFFVVPESDYSCWHFDDSVLHCTTEVTSPRIQIRVFGKLNVEYTSLFKDTSVPGFQSRC